jgi:DNA-binding SARP family transcriptional activator
VAGVTDPELVASGSAQAQQLIASLVARLESNDSAAAATKLLDRVSGVVDRVVDPAVDPAAASLLVAMDHIAVRWRCEADHLEICRRAQSNAVNSEAETRRSLITALHAIAELIPDSSDRPADSHRDREAAATTGVQIQPDLRDGMRRDRLAAFLLGFSVVQSRGCTIENWRGAMAARVVRYLMFRCGQPIHRDILIETFWPECDAETGRHNLHQTMYVIRRVLRDHTGLNHIAFENESYVLDRDSGFWCDVEEFEKSVTAGRRADREGRTDDAVKEFEQVLALYAGDLLEDMPHEEWALTERDRLRLEYLDCTNRLAALQLADGAVDAALETSQRVLRCDPCDEAAHRQVMLCYSLTGQRPLVAQQYRTCRSALADTLDLEPSKETTELYRSLVDA